jgi:hypothetical protein
LANTGIDGHLLRRLLTVGLLGGGPPGIHLSYVFDKEAVSMGIPSQVFGEKGVRCGPLFLTENISDYDISIRECCQE